MMEILYNSIEYAELLRAVVNKYPTYYAWGAFGAPACYGNNKTRYKVPNAPDKAFLIDCSGFTYKMLPWGWCGDYNRAYGGAQYMKIPELETNDIMSLCKDVSEDFSNIQVGEELYMKGSSCGHVGLYLGAGVVAECTSDWKCGALFSELSNVGIKTGLPYKRTWLRHGKLPFLQYAENPIDPVNPDRVQLEQESIDKIRKELNELEKLIHG